MKELDKHREAFEYFLSLGGQASDSKIREVAVKFQVADRTIWNWYKSLNWRNRADIRLNAIAKKVEEKTDTNIVNRKAKELADLDSTDTIIQAMIEDAKLKVKINDARDFAQVVGASEKVKKLKQLLLGEDTKREGIDAHLEIVSASQIINNKPKIIDEDE